MAFRRDSIYDVRQTPGNASMSDTLGSQATLDQMREQVGVRESEVTPRIFQAKIVLPFNLKRTDYSPHSRSPQEKQGLTS